MKRDGDRDGAVRPHWQLIDGKSIFGGGSRNINWRGRESCLRKFMRENLIKNREWDRVLRTNFRKRLRWFTDYTIEIFKKYIILINRNTAIQESSLQSSRFVSISFPRMIQFLSRV